VDLFVGEIDVGNPQVGSFLRSVSHSKEKHCVLTRAGLFRDPEKGFEFLVIVARENVIAAEEPKNQQHPVGSSMTGRLA
jgi:hypothetical protein